MYGENGEGPGILYEQNGGRLLNHPYGSCSSFGLDLHGSSFHDTYVDWGARKHFTGLGWLIEIMGIYQDSKRLLDVLRNERRNYRPTRKSRKDRVLKVVHFMSPPPPSN